MTNPYDTLPPQAFWRTGVVEGDLDHVHAPRFFVDDTTPIATAGSCFAQHIAKALRAAGGRVLEAEPAPRDMPADQARDHGYGLFSVRTGNIYTPRALLQFLDDVASGHIDPAFVWDRDGRFFDAFRPGVEPDGCDSAAEVLLMRSWHLERTAAMLRQTDMFVFTLGLTECWCDLPSGRVFPMAPGIIAGQFDEEQHGFCNLSFAEVRADLESIATRLRLFNPKMKLLLTVSPVPLTATASGEHVLTATMHSKAILRAAAGDYIARDDNADYFPSYEMVMSPARATSPFEPNLRSVRPEVIAEVMGHFLTAHGLPGVAAPDTPDTMLEIEDEVVCEDLLLEAFAK